MSKIIVSYRRSDSAAITGRIVDRLADRYGEESVFMDIDQIPFGTDFRHHIRDALRDADILLAVVGPNWLGKAADGRSRIQDEADPVRVEVETALRQGLSVIPLLVDNATMPGAADLPESIRDFAYINAAPIDVGRDFRAHMDRLTRSIDGIVGRRNREKAKSTSEKFEPVATTDVRPKRKARSIGKLRLTLAVIVVLGGGALTLWPHLFRDLRDLVLPTQRPNNIDLKALSKMLKEMPASPNELPEKTTEPPPKKRVLNFDDLVSQPERPKVQQQTYRVLANVSGGYQNLRSGPAVKYKIVIPIPAGATGIVLGACRDAEDNTRPWCQATWRGLSGWISTCCIVDEKTGASPPYPPP